MAYNEKPADRIREALLDISRVEEKFMSAEFVLWLTTKCAWVLLTMS